MTASHPPIVRHNGETHRQLGKLCVGEMCHPGLGNTPKGCALLRKMSG